MKKLILAILLVLVTASFSFAETCTFDDGGGDHLWSNAVNWNCSVSGEKVPANGDDVVLSAAVTWDVATVPRIPAAGSLGTITASGAYGVAVNISNAACNVSGTCQINFTTATTNTENLFTTSGATSNDVTFNGTSITGSAATANKCGIYHSSGGKAIVNAALIGGGVSLACGLRLDGIGSKADLYRNVTGGSGASTYGAFNYGGATSVITVKGTNTPTVTGGSVPTASGVALGITPAVAGAAIVVEAGVKLVNDDAPAIGCAFTWNAGADDYWTIAGTVTRVAKEVANTDLKAGVKNGTVTGTLSSGGGAWGF